MTELPGPKARAHLEFDRQWTSPSVPRAYPVVPVPGEGCVLERRLTAFANEILASSPDRPSKAVPISKARAPW